jgi:preprotein translocase subunit SecY
VLNFSNSLAKNNNSSELSSRLVFLLLSLVVYRIGAHIPVPGISPHELTQLFKNQSGGVLSLFNMFSGGALSRFTVFALGIMPYISASIVMQLMTYMVPFFENLKKDGESGRKKINQYTRYATLVLAIFQSFSVALAFDSLPGLVLFPGFGFRLTTVISLVSGTVFLMWLGEQITERGLGNGISILIFAGIASGLPVSLSNFNLLVSQGSISVVASLFFMISMIALTFLVVFFEKSQRKILINYAKRQVGAKLYGAKSSHLPLKINMAGVIPPIFASSIVLLPATVLGWFAVDKNNNIISNFVNLIQPGRLIYIIFYAISILFFSFFYTTLIFNGKETADNLKKSGGYVPGIRPGFQTSRYLDGIVSRLTLIGSIYIVLICLIPEVLIVKYNVPFNFGGTSLLIIVVVTIDFWTQIQSQVFTKKYEAFFKNNPK